MTKIATRTIVVVLYPNAFMEEAMSSDHTGRVVPVRAYDGAVDDLQAGFPGPRQLIDVDHPARAFIHSAERFSPALDAFNGACLVIAEFEPAGFSAEHVGNSDWPACIRASVPHRQCEFFAGRWAACRAMASMGVHTAGMLAIGQHRQPLWPESIRGSITHASHHVAAIAGHAGGVAGVGIDLESIVDPHTADDLATQAVDADEISMLRRSDLPWLTAITLAFSIKESFFKAAYASVGDYFGFDSVRIVAVNAASARVTLRIESTLAPSLCSGRELSAQFAFIEPSLLLTAIAIQEHVKISAN
ncbi:4'-phosphopantetheinyl transferase family protein [Xanthomonas arboricola]|uniref:4'-phosphopantetheinyl transferase family protein n=1 Tax=Xanthomonas arboricola TaxID=56448 RepID=UPI0006ACF34D|nr:4'-phosphopantetheinyl transferase superfamily protein [Xanthomonas arboricola]